MSQEPKKESKLPAEKVRKIAVATTVAGVLLIVFLLIVLIIQFWQLGVKNRERSELDSRIAEQQELIKNKEANLDYYVNGKGMFWEAFEYVNKFKND